MPGLIVLSPYDATDCKFLMKAALRSNNPVCFLENELTYGTAYEVDDGFWDEEAVAPIGKARVMREGKHATVVAFSRMVGIALEAAAKLEADGISVEVINLRSIKPLDRKTIIDSVKKTRRLVAVEDGYPSSGVTAEVLSTIMESPAFDYLDAPAERVTGWDLPLPYAQPIEGLCVPQVENIIKAVRKTLQGAKI